MLEVRPAHKLDAREMADLLNQIIRSGGTTAIVKPVSADYIAGRIAASFEAWFVAELDGAIVGFQYFAPSSALPPEATNIATFVQEGRTGLGIGSKLFDVTAKEARVRGYSWINADIRADNESGLTYYQSRGFRNWKRVENVTLSDGTVVDKVWKRYDLD